MKWGTGRYTAPTRRRDLLSWPADQKRLRVIAVPVMAVDDRLADLVRQLATAMADNNGVGLAAPQLGVALRLLLVTDEGRHQPRVLINPSVVPTSPPVVGWEGCLSFPGLYAEIPRPGTCEVLAHDLDDEPIAFTARGLLARVVQHELDHLDGVLLIDHLTRGQRARLRTHRAQVGTNLTTIRLPYDD